jgi:hypothetical protein
MYVLLFLIPQYTLCFKVLFLFERNVYSAKRDISGSKKRGGKFISLPISMLHMFMIFPPRYLLVAFLPSSLKTHG